MPKNCFQISKLHKCLQFYISNNKRTDLRVIDWCAWFELSITYTWLHSYQLHKNNLNILIDHGYIKLINHVVK